MRDSPLVAASVSPNKVLELTPGIIAALRGIYPAGATQHKR